FRAHDRILILGKICATTPVPQCGDYRQKTAGRATENRQPGEPGANAPFAKSEARNPKSETNTKPKGRMTQTTCLAVWGLGLSGLGFVSDFVLRISVFGPRWRLGSRPSPNRLASFPHFA